VTDPPEPPRPRVGDRVESAIERHVDLPAEVRRGEEELERAPKRGRGGLRRTVFWLGLGAISLYLVAPSVIETLGSWRQIERIGWMWLGVMAALQTGVLACLWAVQRVAIQGARWQPVIASQLAGNALAKVAPGGGAMGSALQYRMLVATGSPGPRVIAGLTASNLLVFAVVLALPVFSLPAIVRGGVQHDLLNAAVVGLVVFVVLFAGGVVLVSSDRPLMWIGRVVQRVRNRLRRRSEPLERLPERLVAERDRIVTTLGPRWKRALAAAIGRWALDFGSLLAALRALDALPRPGLVLLAFCAAQVLAQIPVTPGGLGFVEAGLTATLTLAGVAAGTAVVATFAYRLFSYWLQLPLGLLGLALQRAPVASARGAGGITPSG
jgi:uncharacterized protein (TIRG00374 family)